MAIVAVLVVGVRTMSLTAPALAEHQPASRSAEAQVERAIVPRTPTAASDGLPTPILVGGIVLAFAVGLTAGQMHRRRRAAVRSRTAPVGPPRAVSSAPARPAPPPPEPASPPAPKPLGIAPTPPAAPAPPPPEPRPAPPRVVQPPPAPAKPPPEPKPEPPRFQTPAPEPEPPRSEIAAPEPQAVEPEPARVETPAAEPEAEREPPRVETPAAGPDAEREPPRVEESTTAPEEPKRRRRAKPRAKRKTAKRKAAKPQAMPSADQPGELHDPASIEGATPGEPPAAPEPGRRPRAKRQPRAAKPSKARPGRSRASQPRSKPRHRAKPADSTQPAADVPLDRASSEPAPPTKPAADIPRNRATSKPTDPAAPAEGVPLDRAPEIPRAEGPIEAVDLTAPLDLSPEALRAPGPEPPSDPEAVPARRFARATPWPEDADQLWTCEIGWKAGYRKSVFRAMAGAPGGGKPEPLGESPRVGWMLMGDPEPPTPELAVRVRALMNALEAAGWEHIGRGVTWYAQRFVWRGRGTPQPITVEDVVEAGEPPQA